MISLAELLLPPMTIKSLLFYCFSWNYSQQHNFNNTWRNVSSPGHAHGHDRVRVTKDTWRPCSLWLWREAGWRRQWKTIVGFTVYRAEGCTRHLTTTIIHNMVSLKVNTRDNRQQAHFSCQPRIGVCCDVYACIHLFIIAKLSTASYTGGGGEVNPLYPPCTCTPSLAFRLD